MKLKLPPMPPKLRFRKDRPKTKRLQATARRTATAFDDLQEEEPTTRFGTAFAIVLILHVVAVGGVIAFKSMAARRAAQEAVISGEKPKTAVQKPAASEQTQQTTPAAVAQASETTAQPPVASAPATPAAGTHLYHVKQGDTLQKIGATYGVSATDIAEANGMKESALLHVGQTLNIPAAKVVAKASTPAAKAATPDARKTDLARKADDVPKAGAPKTYVVKKGDNPVAIARRFNVSYDELLKLNNIDDPKKLQIGASLKLPPPKKKAGDVEKG